MIRKLIQLSPSTSVVSMPAPWVKKNKLMKGAEIFVEENDNKIILSTDNVINEKKIELDITKLNGRLMWAVIDAAYISGYDSIIITTKDQKQNRLMTKVVKYFPGMMIFEERKNKVHFKDMASGSRGDLDKIISRIFNLNVALLEDSIEAIENNDWELLKDIKRRDYNINSYISYCLRQLNKFGYSPLSKLGLMHGFIKILEMLSDKLCSLFTKIGENKIKMKKDISFISKILEIYRDLARIHFKFTQEKLINIEDKRNKLLSGLPISSNQVNQYLTEILELFFDIEEMEIQLNT